MRFHRLQAGDKESRNFPASGFRAVSGALARGSMVQTTKWRIADERLDQLRTQNGTGKAEARERCFWQNSAMEYLSNTVPNKGVILEPIYRYNLR